MADSVEVRVETKMLNPTVIEEMVRAANNVAVDHHQDVSSDVSSTLVIVDHQEVDVVLAVPMVVMKIV